MLLKIIPSATLALIADNIRQDAAALAEKIRAYVRGQKEIWQCVPWWALKADGRTGRSNANADAYDHGIWRLTASRENGRLTAYVDLATGEIIDAGVFQARRELPCPITDDVRILALARRLEELDAVALVERLKNAAQQPDGKWNIPAKRRRPAIQPIFTAEQRPSLEDLNDLDDA